MKNVVRTILGLALLSLTQCMWRSSVLSSQSVFTPATAATKLHFPQPWLDPERSTNSGEAYPLSSIEHIEVRKAPNSADGELLFAAIGGYFDGMYSYEVDKSRSKPQYSLNVYAVDFAKGMQVRTATQEEWENATRVLTKSRFISANGDYESPTAQIEYRQKRYGKPGQYWGNGGLSPTGKWLASFSYSGVMREGFLPFSGRSVWSGDAFWEIYDTVTGKKVFASEAKNVKNPAGLNGPVIWIDDRYFLFPQDDMKQNFVVVTLPGVTPEENPVTIQFPSRRDASGQPVPAGFSHPVWTPLVPLTKEQAAKLTAPSETEIMETRLLDQGAGAEVVFAIREETENRTESRRQQRDGAGDYNYRLFNTYYYAFSLENPTQTRFATKEEWDHARSLTNRHAEILPQPEKDTITGTIPPQRPLSKSGKSWGSPQALSAGEWMAVFSYDGQGSNTRAIVDVYEQRLGYKLFTTTLPVSTSPNELFKHAFWIEKDYMLLPLNSSLDSFALWRLPGGV